MAGPMSSTCHGRAPARDSAAGTSAGMAVFGDQYVDVVTEGGFIPSGARVQVIEVAARSIGGLCAARGRSTTSATRATLRVA